MKKTHKSSISSTSFYATLVAAAVTTVLAVGFVANASWEHASGEYEKAPSFLQVSEQRLRGEPQKTCPAELLQEFSDCTVVPFRGNIPLGKHGLRPQTSHGRRLRVAKDGRKFLASSARHQNSVMVYKALETKQLPGTRSVLGWKPVMQDAKSTCEGEADRKVSLVHHINAYMFPDFQLPSDGIFPDSSPELIGLDESRAVMVASHDKLAGTYILPSGYGIPANSPITLEYHVLFPKCWNHDAEDQMENSGMDLYMTGQPTKKSAALVGAINFNMDIAPHPGMVDYVTRASAETIQGALLSSTVASRRGTVLAATDALGDPEILAVHLHTHDMTDWKSFEILNADGSTEFRSDDEKGGYGLKEQSFFSPAEKGWPVLKLKAGQHFQQHCKINSEHLTSNLVYGLEWGQEMCAPLLIVSNPGLEPPPTVLSTLDTSWSFLGRQLAGFAKDVLHEMGRLTVGL